jgi:hypothetical protein
VRQRELHGFTSPSEIEQVLMPAEWTKWTRAIRGGSAILSSTGRRSANRAQVLPAGAKLDSQHADAHNHLGIASLDTRRLKDAEQHFRAAVDGGERRVERDGALVPWGIIENRPYHRALGKVRGTDIAGVALAVSGSDDAGIHCEAAAGDSSVQRSGQARPWPSLQGSDLYIAEEFGNSVGGCSRLLSHGVKYCS